jgi:hypothetical protein
VELQEPYRTPSLKTVAWELGKFRLKFVCAQVKWDKMALNSRTILIFLSSRERGSPVKTRFFFAYKGITSTIRTVEFISDRM